MCVFGFSLGICCVQGVPGASTFQPVISFMTVERLAWDCLGSFHMLYVLEHGEGEASKALFVGQVVESIYISTEDDGR